jgi:hypothetical protein
MSQSDIAAETVLAQIAGLDGECARIDEQIKHLSARREGIMMMKHALTPLVAGRINGTGVVHVGVANIVEPNDTPAMIGSKASQATNDDHTGHSNSTGFREAVRKVLRDYPKGLRPAEVLEELKKRGELAKLTGKSKPASRVHNELYTMRKSGALSRRGGRYAMNMGVANSVN